MIFDAGSKKLYILFLRTTHCLEKGMHGILLLVSFEYCISD